MLGAAGVLSKCSPGFRIGPRGIPQLAGLILRKAQVYPVRTESLSARVELWQQRPVCSGNLPEIAAKSEGNPPDSLAADGSPDIRLCRQAPAGEWVFLGGWFGFATSPLKSFPTRGGASTWGTGHWTQLWRRADASSNFLPSRSRKWLLAGLWELLLLIHIGTMAGKALIFLPG